MPGPRLISTWSFSRRGHASAGDVLAGGGSSLDAVEAVCRCAESDPQVDSVGYGGLPDRSGVVSLDGCVMLSPRAAGSVCNVRRHRHPVTIARAVMERTPHLMLAGPGADEFADELGFPRETVLADVARSRYEAWRQDPTAIDQSRDAALLRPLDDGVGGALFGAPDERRWAGHDTVGVLALDTAGIMAGACSTSGTPFKRPGRIGDSPIFGHGLYVDPAAGGATATGTGELMMGVCASFLVVEEMRRGATTLAALRTTLERIRDGGPLKPEDQVALIAMRPDGTVAAGALRPGFRYVLSADTRCAVREPELVLIPE
ncbi:MAG: N(4)-(beta-N-acetylglucosaminyl)-L-asparaginase [Phycisphaerales bacterium]|nr:N(4)-(beta-N-acetylglucosaminyl)-L-asparaginase [Phycisphaerales bacterium]NNM24793.1 N(4)-(beta-N-acetylglucosaminyl)-L-asparaginase [Phycisphaerales bacterium]